MSYKSYKNEVLKAFEKAKKDICNDIGNFVVAEAQTRATVDTGNMRRSISYESMDDFNGINVGVTGDAPYAIFVEKGSSRQEAQPFLEPSVMSNIDKIEEIVKQNIAANMGGN